MKYSLSDRKVSWKTGWLSPAESFASFAVKFCRFNMVTPKQLVAFLSRNNLTNTKKGIDFGPVLIDANFLARILDEDVVLIKTLDENNYKFLNFFGIEPSSSNSFFGNLRFCETCIKEQFHSVLHQYRYADRCFIHDRELKDSAPQSFRSEFHCGSTNFIATLSKILPDHPNSISSHSERFSDRYSAAQSLVVASREFRKLFDGSGSKNNLSNSSDSQKEKGITLKKVHVPSNLREVSAITIKVFEFPFSFDQSGYLAAVINGICQRNSFCDYPILLPYESRCLHFKTICSAVILNHFRCICQIDELPPRIFDSAGQPNLRKFPRALAAHAVGAPVCVTAALLACAKSFFIEKTPSANYYSSFSLFDNKLLLPSITRAPDLSWRISPPINDIGSIRKLVDLILSISAENIKATILRYGEKILNPLGGTFERDALNSYLTTERDHLHLSHDGKSLIVTHLHRERDPVDIRFGDEHSLAIEMLKFFVKNHF